MKTMASEDTRLKLRLDEERKKIFNKARTCLFPNCSAQAIGSHVLQRSSILNSIVDNSNHFYSIGSVSAFEMSEGNLFKIKKVGIKAGYKFLGFCSHHDHSVFKEIETLPLDLYNRRNQLLFVYRTICLELRKQHIYVEINQSAFKTMRELEPDKMHAMILEPALMAVKDLEFFKKEIENELFDSTACAFVIETLMLPLRQICFSASVTIEDRSNPNTSDVDEYGFLKDTPVAVSVLNYFPYNGHSYFIIGYHRTLFCNWSINLIKALRKRKNIDKILSDILTYRLEFFGMSPMFYEQLSAEVRKRFMQESHAHIHNFKYKIKSDFNLFE